jgi:transcriptional regulator with XRE-family HTH domain
MIRKKPVRTEAPGMGAAQEWQAKIAVQIREARIALGLSRRELAERVATRPSTIARFEDPNYRGHSLAMLGRIAHSLRRQLRVELSGDDDSETENVAAAQWLRTCAPSHDEMLKWAETSEIPPELQNNEQEERPW